ncbi:hypothetical protein Salat_2156000 [Sesamum alatum]|uniref:Uncharacterized protein n=1 Tax=Sesamum alatum TaxID=300844 RepID=A0AAE1Y2H5_9LAMI|nr:hypothetical protein Salat_2156000 [Sesamum alatum]
MSILSTPATAIEVASGEGHMVALPPKGTLPADANIGASGSQEVEVAEGPSAKDADEEKENTKHLKEMVVWWRQAREELKISSSTAAEMEGEKLDPDWAISARSSVLHSLMGRDSWELYKACLLEHDQVLLTQTSHTRVEEHIAHAIAFSHDLSLMCSMFRHQKGVTELKIIDLQKEVSDAKQKEKEALDTKSVLEA